MQKIILTLFLSALQLTLVLPTILPSTVMADVSKIVKWVDSNGVTHYGDKLPPQDAGRSNVEMSSKGTVVKKNIKVDQKTELIDLEKAKLKADQERKDKILLASYTNANEIDLARDRSLNLDQSALSSLSSQKDNLKTRITRNNQTAEGFKYRKKPLPTNLDKEFKDTVAQSDRIDKQIADRKIAMEVTRNNYANDKARFMILKQPAEAVSSNTTPIISTSKDSVSGASVPALTPNVPNGEPRSAVAPTIMPAKDKGLVEKNQTEKTPVNKK